MHDGSAAADDRRMRRRNRDNSRQRLTFAVETRLSVFLSTTRLGTI
jgi:hypothetical protein